MIEKPKGHLMVNYLGLRGAGKTLSAIHQEVLPRYLKGDKIFSTSFINLKGVDYETVQTPKDCLNLRNCVLVIDELGDFVDAYDWANISQDFRRFLRLSRKRKVDIITTAQDISYIAKPLRVLFSDWVYCENATPVGLGAKILSWLGLFRVKIKQQELTANELVRLQKGVGNNPLKDEEDEDEDLELNDFDFADEDLERKVETIEYSKKDLIREDLEQFKIYNYQEYCPVCDVGYDYIDKEKEESLIDYNKKQKYFFKKDRFCQIHQAQKLEVRQTGIYDTDFEIPVPLVPDLIFKAYIPSPKGYQNIPYKGIIPESQKPPLA
jgi:hypothetical protein